MNKEDLEYISVLRKRRNSHFEEYKNNKNPTDLMLAEFVNQTILAIKEGEYSYKQAVADSKFT